MRVIKSAAAAALVLAGLAAAGGAASADPPAPAPSGPGPKTTIDGDGVYKVGTDIAPGTYASAGPANNGTCSWRRASGDNKTLDNAISHKAQIVAIDGSDATFKTSGCQAWSLTDQAPPASMGNLQGQALMAVLNGLGTGLGSAPLPGAPAPQASSAAGAAAAPAAAPAGALPGPAPTGALPGPAPQAAPTGPLPGPAGGTPLPAEAGAP